MILEEGLSCSLLQTQGSRLVWKEGLLQSGLPGTPPSCFTDSKTLSTETLQSTEESGAQRQT